MSGSKYPVWSAERRVLGVGVPECPGLGCGVLGDGYRCRSPGEPAHIPGPPGCSPMAARLSCSATAWPPRGSPLPGSSLAEGPAPGLQGWPPSLPCTPLPGPASYLLSSPQELSQPLTRRDPASPLMGPPRVTSRQALSPQPSMQP